MRKKRNTFPSVLLAILSALGFLIGSGIAGILILTTLPVQRGVDIPLISNEIFINFAIIFLSLTISMVNLFTFLSAVRYLRNKPSKPIRPINASQKLILLILWILSLTAGYFASQNPRWYPALAGTTTIAIWLPILLLISIARSGLPRSTHQRELGTITLGLSVAPGLIIILEFVLIFLIAIIIFILLGLQNPLQAQVPQILESLSNTEGGMQQLELVLFDFMKEPLIALGVFLALGVIAPMLEEIFKPMAIWFLLKRPLKDHEGYALGLISGGAFALLESAGMVIQMNPADWLAAVVLRAATGVLHIGLSGIVGFGLVNSRKIRKPGRGVLFILLSGVLHGGWNSLALYSGLAAILNITEPNRIAPNTGTIISIVLMVFIFIAIVAINFFINRFIRRNLHSNLPEN